MSDAERRHAEREKARVRLLEAAVGAMLTPEECRQRGRAMLAKQDVSPVWREAWRITAENWFDIADAIEAQRRPWWKFW
jgi:hypothetical protein